MMNSEKNDINETDDINAEDDILLLCNLLEEYKELSDNRLLENKQLVEYINSITNENNQLHEINQAKTHKIQSLEISINQLLEDIENMNKVITSKESDLQSLHHCLNLVHRRKVEVDDQTQIEQSRIIQKLYSEKESIQKNYSENLKTLEYYLDIINSKESEIMELKLLIKTNEGNISDQDKNQDNNYNSNDNNNELPILIDTYTSPEILSINPIMNKTKSTHVHIIPPPTNTPPKRLTMNIKSFLERSSQLKDQTTISSIDQNSIPLSNTNQSNNNNDKTSLFINMNNRYNNNEEEEEEEEEELSPVAVTINRNYINRINRNASLNNLRQAQDISFSSIASKRNSPTTIVDNTQQNIISHSFHHPQSSSTKKRDDDTMFYNQHNYKLKNNSYNHHHHQEQRIPTMTPKSWKDIKKHEKLFSDTQIFKYPSSNNDADSDRI